VNWVLPETGDEPLGVQTTTSTVPAPCAGATAVIEPAASTVNDAHSSPNITADAPVKLLPVRVTTSPPRVEPALTDRLLIEGAEAAL
jgi:hypothetical protein